MSVIVDLSIFPLDKGGSGLGRYVARTEAVLEKSGLDYKLGPMGTAIEGEWDEVMQAVSECYHALEPDCDRIYVTIKADSRKGRSNGLTGKLASVASHAG
ncbi:MTH1187 family thiamine-binding protein [Pseudodesulfovibrio sp.]|uniref:MTH1187 family thiamine-binding protein n=1 Tax=unclassified Pseudodesulfovibrio TaxID=2661612 RepID=UPI003B00326F